MSDFFIKMIEKGEFGLGLLFFCGALIDIFYLVR